MPFSLSQTCTTSEMHIFSPIPAIFYAFSVFSKLVQPQKSIDFFNTIILLCFPSVVGISKQPDTNYFSIFLVQLVFPNKHIPTVPAFFLGQLVFPNSSIPTVPAFPFGQLACSNSRLPTAPVFSSSSWYFPTITYQLFQHFPRLVGISKQAHTNCSSFFP